MGEITLAKVGARSSLFLARAVHVALLLVAGERLALAQQQPLCLPGTPVCARAGANGSVQAGGSVHGQIGPNGANAGAGAGVTVQGNAGANARVNANAGGGARANADATAQGGAGTRANPNVRVDVDATANPNVRTDVHAGANGSFEGRGHAYSSGRARGPSEPIRFGAGVAFCGTLKAGVLSGLKAGPCFAVSFRTVPLTFEMETQLLFGGVRHSIDWVFPMSFVIPLTSQWSLYEGLQLRVGGSPIGVTFAKESDGGTYIRFGLHAGLSYEWGVSKAVSWRVFDARAFLDFGTKREVDLHQDFLDFGAQLSTGIVF